MGLQFSVLASGSTGNAFYLETEEHSFLVDAGLSGKAMDGLMEKIGRKIDDVDGIFVTHEHSDHIKGLGVIARKYGLPVDGKTVLSRNDAEPFNMVAVLMSDKDAVDVVYLAADFLHQPVHRFTAQAGIHQKRVLLCLQIKRVSGTPARKHAKLQAHCVSLHYLF